MIKRSPNKIRLSMHNIIIKNTKIRKDKINIY